MFFVNLKNSFRSQDIQIFILTNFSCRKTTLIRKIRLISKFMTPQPGYFPLLLNSRSSKHSSHSLLKKLSKIPILDLNKTPHFFQILLLYSKCRHFSITIFDTLILQIFYILQIQIFFLTNFSCRKTALIRKIRLISKFMTPQPGYFPLLLNSRSSKHSSHSLLKKLSKIPILDLNKTPHFFQILLLYSKCRHFSITMFDTLILYNILSLEMNFGNLY